MNTSPKFFRALPNKFKPGELVTVAEADYLYTGQVMSREFDIDNTGDTSRYMVRRVPGHPGTLEEIATSKLRVSPLAKTKHVYVHYAAVAGPPHSSFPVDMLRYDSASPLNFEMDTDENYRVHTAIDHMMKLGNELVIACASSKSRPDWTKARWSSFGWGLRELKTELLEDR